MLQKPREEFNFLKQDIIKLINEYQRVVSELGHLKKENEHLKNKLTILELELLKRQNNSQIVDAKQINEKQQKIKLELNQILEELNDLIEQVKKRTE